MVGELCKNSCLQQFRIIHPVKNIEASSSAAREEEQPRTVDDIAVVRHPARALRPLPRSTSGRRKVTQPKCERQGGPRPPVPPRAQRLIHRRLQPARGWPPPSAGWDRHRRERRESMEQRGLRPPSRPSNSNIITKAMNKFIIIKEQKNEIITRE
jgi:hypothetical protein